MRYGPYTSLWPSWADICARGLEDTFYLPDGTNADSNGPLIEQLAKYARNVGREVASPQEARGMLGLNPLEAATAF